MDELIERLNDAWRKLYGDGDEHDVCDTLAEAAAALEAAREDAERWRHARRILTVEDIEKSQAMFNAFGFLKATSTRTGRPTPPSTRRA